MLDLWKVTTKWTWLLWIFFLPIAYLVGKQTFSPPEFSHWLMKLCFLGLFFPSAFTLFIGMKILPKCFCKSGDEYELNEKGIHRRSLVLPLHVGWRRIENYRFARHDSLPEIWVLKFKIKGSNSWQQFFFDPQQTAQEEIQNILNQHISETGEIESKTAQQ